MGMQILRPKREDLDAAWGLLNILHCVSSDLNPLVYDEELGEYELMDDEDAPAVLAEIARAFNAADMHWLMMVLETLLSPENGLVDQESDNLDFSPEVKAVLSAHRAGGTA